VERALREGNHGDHYSQPGCENGRTGTPASDWTLLREYQGWFTTAPKSPDIASVAKLDLRPVLVLTGESDAQKMVFYDQVPDGQHLLVFGATPTRQEAPLGTPEMIEPAPADNYHRWWNNFWGVVEAGSPPKAGEWTPRKSVRSLVQHAHKQGLWIRFYTLEGVLVPQLSSFGWVRNYNFGSSDAVAKRWTAAIVAGVDFIATDQYEDLAAVIEKNSSKTARAARDELPTRQAFQ
jgi:hypothetical protein